ncbi:hypothetical protein U9M48_029018, partial [Paspalum notatum var. saurae]
KGARFEWTTACEKSFQELKAGLTIAPVLVQPDIFRDFVIYCDASRQGLGCVLMQDGKVIAYASRKLKDHEQNYPTHDLELAARIVSDRGTQFTSRFWKSLHEAMGTNLDFCSAYHPRTDSRTERINQIMEDMLRACVLTYGKDWESSLPYAEVSYNNGHQTSLGMAPFEALYGRKCRTPLMWSEAGERTVLGPALIKEAEEKVAEIRARLKEAQSRQKSYADNRRRELSFQVGDSVYLKVSPIRGTHRFQVKGKLAPRYIGPYPMVRQVGKVAYKLRLPESMSDIHDVFHVSQLENARECQNSI